MKKAIVISMLVIAGLCAGRVHALDTQAAINKGLNEFLSGVVDYFKTTPEAVKLLKALGIKDEEQPLVFLVAGSSKAKPEDIARMRRAGTSWYTIMRKYNVSPEVVYVPIKGRVSGPPYGNAYGYFRNRSQANWKNIRLTNVEAVNMANVKYLSSYHQIPPEEVIRQRTSGLNFVAIDNDIRKQKKVKAAQGQGPRGQGQGNQGNGNQVHGNQGNGNGQGNQVHGNQGQSNQVHGNQGNGNQGNGNRGNGNQGQGNGKP